MTRDHDGGEDVGTDGNTGDVGTDGNTGDVGTDGNTGDVGTDGSNRNGDSATAATASGDDTVGDADPPAADDPVVPPAASGDSTVPDESPTVCPVCGDPYESLSDHDAGLMVNLLDNERYRRVCFRPVSDGDTPLVRFFHHTHDQT